MCSLRPFTFFAVIAPFAVGFRGLDSLTIDNGRTWFRIPSRCLPHFPPQGGIDAFPSASITKAPEVIVHGHPVRIVGEQIATPTASPQLIEAAASITARRSTRRGTSNDVCGTSNGAISIRQIKVIAPLRLLG